MAHRVDYASVGRGHVPAACRNYQVRTNLFIPTVCRFAVIGDMSPPYKGCFVYRGAFFACGLRGAQRRGNLVQERWNAYKPIAGDCHDRCAAFPKEGALRMQRALTGNMRTGLAMTDRGSLSVVVMKPFVVRGHVPALHWLFRLLWCVLT